MNTVEKSEPTHGEIAVLAYNISQSNEGRVRTAEENWYEAERILRSQKLVSPALEKKQSTRAKSATKKMIKKLVSRTSMRLKSKKKTKSRK